MHDTSIWAGWYASLLVFPLIVLALALKEWVSLRLARPQSRWRPNIRLKLSHRRRIAP